MSDFREMVELDGRMVLTRRDILPDCGPMRMLILGKTPTPSGLAGAHYFQGNQGRMLWRRLQEYGLLAVPPGRYADELLLAHGYGITNIVKQPHPFGVEPSAACYRQGIPRVLELIARLRPRVVLFVYKRALDQLLRLGMQPGSDGLNLAPTQLPALDGCPQCERSSDGSSHQRKLRTSYGFNPHVEPLLGCKVFAFPLPGTPCRAADAQAAMAALRAELVTDKEEP